MVPSDPSDAEAATPVRPSRPSQRAVGVLASGLVQLVVLALPVAQLVRSGEHRSTGGALFLGLVLALFITYVRAWSALALAALAPARFPRLGSEPTLPHTRRLDRAVEEVRALGFEVLGALVEATPFRRAVSPVLYSREHGVFACVERVFGVPLVVFTSGGDTGPLLQTERRATPPTRFGDLVRQGTPAALPARLEMHLALARELGIAPPPADAPRADLLALRVRVERRYNVELYRGAMRAMPSAAPPPP